MKLSVHLGVSALLVLAAVGTGCSEASSTNPTDITPTPPQVLEPAPPGESQVKPSTAATATEKSDQAATSSDTKQPAELPGKGAEEPAKKDESTSPPAACAEPAAGLAEAELETAAEVTLELVKYNELMARIAANRKAKFTLVDAWATWCPPCKENFPHVVQMNQKYASQGLAVMSLSLDDPTDANAVAEAKKFLKEKKAEFPNFVLNEEQEDAFMKLNVSGIPAVFLYGPDGKEIKRFTLDDPNNQFTYHEVEETVAALLQGKPLPKKEKKAGK